MFSLLPCIRTARSEIYFFFFTSIHSYLLNNENLATAVVPVRFLTHPDKNNLPFVDMEFTSYYFQVLKIHTNNANNLSTNNNNKQQQTVSLVALVALVRKDSSAATTTYNYTLRATTFSPF